MHQESVDRSNNSSKSDLLLLIVLIVAFFAVGGAFMALKRLLDSSVPQYIFVVLVLAAVYLIYRIRLIGYRYTFFYKAPEPEYDERFGEMMIHEDYPYPLGTLVIERIVSAKGTILNVIARDEMRCLLEAEETCPQEYSSAEPISRAFVKPDKAVSLIFCHDAKYYRLYFSASAELISLLRDELSE